MDPASYVDWSELSGLYLYNRSHVDRYRTFQPHISSAGLSTLIVSDFLHDNPGEVNITNWRTYNVYEMAGEREQRIDYTANSLEAIGARRAAAAVRTAQSQSPFEMLESMDFSDPQALFGAMSSLGLPAMMGQFREGLARMMPDVAAEAGLHATPQETPQTAGGQPEYETRAEIETLLSRFVAEHEAELEADLARHGDPRTAPGYTRERRMAELDELRRRDILRDRQQEDAGQLRKLTQTLREQLEQAGDDAKSLRKLEKNRRRFRDLVKWGEHPDDALLPEMRQALQEAGEFMQAFPKLFSPSALTDDPGLNSRLNALGSFDWNRSGGQREVWWDDPAGFSGPWGRYSLHLTFPARRKQALPALLDAVDRLRDQLPELAADWRRELIQHFRNHEVQMQDWEIEDYELGDDEQVTEESILAHAGKGRIQLTFDQEELDARTWFGVDWDEEHGCEIEWDADTIQALNRGRSRRASAGRFDCGDVAILDSGPALTPADVAAFEGRFGIQLPAEYREFLLLHNGGRPEPGHLLLKSDGMEFPVDVFSFLPLLPETDESAPGNLASAAEEARGRNLPASLLPIGRAEFPGVPDGAAPNLWLVLSGKRAGRVGVLDPNAVMGMFGGEIDIAQFPQLAGMLLDSLTTLANSLTLLFKKLRPRPQEDLPDWLRHIRNNDVSAFVAWLDGGGRLKSEHQSYGAHVPMTVVDFLTAEAAPELLGELLQRKHVQPRQVRDSWQRHSRDVSRFRALMPVLDKGVWPAVMNAPGVWDDVDLLEELAAGGVDFNTPIDDEGATPLHFAVQAGNKAAVRWLMEHGADPHKPDKYQRDAFLWAERGPGYDCLPILEGKEEARPTGDAAPDAPGIGVLRGAADQLPAQWGLVLNIQIKTPPVTRIEKAYYPEECHYLLSIDVCRQQVTLKDMHTPRQDYLHAEDWPSILFAPILQWPDLTPLWDTLEVHEFDWPTAMKKRKYQPSPREDLLEAARNALEQAFDPGEAAARGVRLRK